MDIINSAMVSRRNSLDRNKTTEYLPAEKVPEDCISHRARGHSEVLEFQMHLPRFSSKCRCRLAGGQRLGCCIPSHQTTHQSS